MKLAGGVEQWCSYGGYGAHVPTHESSVPPLPPGAPPRKFPAILAKLHQFESYIPTFSEQYNLELTNIESKGHQITLI